MIKSPFLLALVILLSSSGFSQETFRYQSRIESVSKTGFYKINLQPELIANSNADLSDLRIIDNKQNFIPYTKPGSVQKAKEYFVGFPLIEKSENDTTTTIIVENKSRQLIQSLGLRLKNTAVSRTADLAGSDDLKKWYAIKESVTINQSSINNTDAYYQSLSFPGTNYQFLKITIHNKRKSPIKVLEAGIFYKNSLTPQFEILPMPKVVRKDSTDKNTYLYLTFKNSYRINKLLLSVSAPKYYNRRVMVFEQKKNGKDLLVTTNLESRYTSEIPFSSKSNKLELQILNGDNPPLDFAEIGALQLQEPIIAYLEAHKEYKFLSGDKNARLPDYDLKFFTDVVVDSITDIKHLAVIENPLFKNKLIKRYSNYPSLIWVAIIVSLLLLSFLSWKIMKDMKTRDGEND